jgi:hypothetical protein
LEVEAKIANEIFYGHTAPLSTTLSRTFFSPYRRLPILPVAD